MNSWQGIENKEQETIFAISIGSMQYIKFLLKIRFRHTPALSNDSQATQTASDFKKNHPFRYIQGFRGKIPRGLINL